jgi:hypothetical protein
MSDSLAVADVAPLEGAMPMSRVPWIALSLSLSLAVASTPAVGQDDPVDAAPAPSSSALVDPAASPPNGGHDVDRADVDHAYGVAMGGRGHIFVTTGPASAVEKPEADIHEALGDVARAEGLRRDAALASAVQLGGWGFVLAGSLVSLAMVGAEDADPSVRPTFEGIRFAGDIGWAAGLLAVLVGSVWSHQLLPSEGEAQLLAASYNDKRRAGTRPPSRR